MYMHQDIFIIAVYFSIVLAGGFLLAILLKFLVGLYI